MKRIREKMQFRCISALLLSLFLLFPLLLHADMNTYCIDPPFIVGGVTPNLLLMIDNSASMFDLTYVDKGTASRQGHYCYDETYDSTNADGDPNIYTGYFETDKMYEYDFSNFYFFTPSVTSSCPAGNETKSVANTLLVCIDRSVSPAEVTRFVANGNYLNWLTASKFDVQKK